MADHVKRLGREWCGWCQDSVQTERSGYESWKEKEIFSSPEPFRPFTGPIQLLLNGYWGSFPGVKRPECEVGHSHPSGGEVKSEWSYTNAPCNVLMAWTGVTLAFSFYLRRQYC